MTRNLCCGLRWILEDICPLDSSHCFWLVSISHAHGFNNNNIFSFMRF